MVMSPHTMVFAAIKYDNMKSRSLPAGFEDEKLHQGSMGG